jgi:hypothetical protein
MVGKIHFVIGIKMISPKAVDDLLTKVNNIIKSYGEKEARMVMLHFILTDLELIKEDLEAILEDDT